MGTSQAIVDLLTSHISQGAYRAGERLPSLRELGQLHKISIARAVRIYASLVDAGLVEVRDRAGYFVSAKSAPDRCTPAPLMDDAADFESFVVTTLGSKPNQERVSFSAAYPGSDLFPIGELHRLLRVASRVQLPGSFVYEDAQGLLALRQRISHLYATAGKNVAASEIVTTSGGIEAVQLALSACARSGKAVVGSRVPRSIPCCRRSCASACALCPCRPIRCAGWISMRPSI